MSNVVIIIQILFVTIGMIILGMILNYFLGLRKEAQREMRKKALNLQERMRNAQLLGDYQLMAQTQQESIQFMKQMMKKQFIPICIRCVFFLGIFAVLGIIYSDYDSGILPFPLLIFGSGWVAIYIIFSISISLIIYGVKRLYKKITGKGTKSQSYLKELMGIISPTQQNTESPFQISSSPQYQMIDSGDVTVEQRNEDLSPRKDSWKERIEE
ncbi:MAG: EMC3/TMCO1 family protein [Candidatus Lokiarchaeia archaeon]